MAIHSVSRICLNFAARLVYKFYFSLRYCPIRDELFVPKVISHSYNLRNQNRNGSSLELFHFSDRCLNVIRDLPVYRLLSIFNLLTDEHLSYGFAKFKTMIQSDNDFFDRFCSEFEGTLSGSLSVFQSI